MGVGGSLFLLDFWKWQIEFHPRNQTLWVSSTVCLHMLACWGLIFPGSFPAQGPQSLCWPLGADLQCQPVMSWNQLSAHELDNTHPSGGTTLRQAPLCVPEAPEPAMVTCLLRATCVGSLHLPVSLLHSFTWAFWDHSPNKPLASNPCLGSASKERHPCPFSSLLPILKAIRGLPGPICSVTRFVQPSEKSLFSSVIVLKNETSELFFVLFCQEGNEYNLFLPPLLLIIITPFKGDKMI